MSKILFDYEYVKTMEELRDINKNDEGYYKGKIEVIEQIKERLDRAIDFPQLDRKRTEGVYIYQELIKVKLLEMLR